MKFSIDHSSSVPLHAQAEALLRNIIEQPAYAEGQLLPNEIDLAKHLAISRSTLRQALNKLVYEGLLVRRKGVGTKVTGKILCSKKENWLSFSQEMRAKGIPIRNFELHLSWKYPDEQTANFLEIGTDKKILTLERLRGTADKPFVYFVSYFHPRIGLTGDEDFKRPLYEILQKDYSTIPNLLKEEISAKLAHEKLANSLEVAKGAPILFRKRFVHDQRDRPIELNLGYYLADCFTYTMESRRVEKSLS